MAKVKKLFSSQVKQIGPEEDRTLRFIVTDETQDRDDDIISFDGWDLKNFAKNPVGLYMHDYHHPPMAKGVNVIKDAAARNIQVDYKFPTLEEMSSNPEMPSDWALLTDTVYNLYKNGYMSAVSVGFDPSEWGKIDGSAWGRNYTKQEMLEVSFVSVPSNPNALETAKSKGLIDEDVCKSLVLDYEDIMATNDLKSKELDTSKGQDPDDLIQTVKELAQTVKVLTEVVSTLSSEGQDPPEGSVEIDELLDGVITFESEFEMEDDMSEATIEFIED